MLAVELGLSENRLSPSMLFYTKSIPFLTAAVCLFAASFVSSEIVAQSGQASEEVEGYEFSFAALGTRVQLKAFSVDKAAVEDAFAHAQGLVRRLENTLTDYDSESETRRLTAAAYAAPTAVSDDLWQVLEASDRWHHRTDGAFDSSLGALTRLWRKARRSGDTPSQDDIASALAMSGWQHVQLQRAAHTVAVDRDGIQFDFGAIGKGYIVDRVFEDLVSRGITSCLVNISGNMRAGQAPPQRDGWRIGISPLEQGGEPLRRITVVDTSIATSGDLWQYMMIDGTRRSHILDPRTGIGVAGPIAATAIAKSATDADALATAACVLGTERAIALVSKLEEQVLVDDARKEHAAELCEPETYELLIATSTNDGEVEVAQTSNFPR